MRISESELEVMKLLWEKSPADLPELIERTKQRRDWDESTIKTLLRRLVGKGAIRRTGERRSYQYTPAISFREYRVDLLRHVAKSFFGSNLVEMFCFFVREEKLSAEELGELEAILKKGSENHD